MINENLGAYMPVLFTSTYIFRQIPGIIRFKKRDHSPPPYKPMYFTVGKLM